MFPFGCVCVGVCGRMCGCICVWVFQANMGFDLSASSTTPTGPPSASSAAGNGAVGSSSSNNTLGHRNSVQSPGDSIVGTPTNSTMASVTSGGEPTLTVESRSERGQYLCCTLSLSLPLLSRCFHGAAVFPRILVAPFKAKLPE